MKDLLSLTVLSFSLALCYGFCFRDLHKVKVKNGELLRPNGCTDIYDGSEHPFGSAWNTAECMRCKCKKKGMECCASHQGLSRSNLAKECHSHGDVTEKPSSSSATGDMVDL
ncbi:small serum protein 5-like isoform X2 [Rhineura floridana]|uniref:small serum protein 5-like isoform X2 n=1 Tax=Rhineura floridana TaxID=261503 RepID=UPI002AC80673|nr:small serum protein 5-like isoform X2 [Rhineura floridana]